MTTSIIYAVIGCAVVFLFQQKRKQLSCLSNEKIPELDETAFKQLFLLLKTAYERTLYMGVFFFPLAWAARPGGEKVMQLFFLSLICLLFISNVLPRNKIMKLLGEHNLTMKELKERGIQL